MARAPFNGNLIQKRPIPGEGIAAAQDLPRTDALVLRLFDMCIPLPISTDACDPIAPHITDMAQAMCARGAA